MNVGLLASATSGLATSVGAEPHSHRDEGTASTGAVLGFPVTVILQTVLHGDGRRF